MCRSSSTGEDLHIFLRHAVTSTATTQSFPPQAFAVPKRGTTPRWQHGGQKGGFEFRTGHWSQRCTHTANGAAGVEDIEVHCCLFWSAGRANRWIAVGERLTVNAVSYASHLFGAIIYRFPQTASHDVGCKLLSSFVPVVVHG